MLQHDKCSHPAMHVREDEWGWASLPPELLESILNFLPPDSVAQTRRTCRSWRDTARYRERSLRPKLLSASLPSCFPRVQSLDLRASREPSLPQLAALRQLSCLQSVTMQLQDCRTTSAIAAQLEDLPLRSLDLSGSQQINNCVISSLGRMTTLQSLKLSDTKVVADTVDLRALWTLTQLKELSFAIRRGRLSGQPMQVYDALEVDDAACAIFEHMPDLEALDLTNQRLITAAGLSRLTALRKLQSLSVGLCPAMCEEGYQIIACLTQLTGLSLDHGCAKSGVMHGPGSPPKTGVLRCIAALPRLAELRMHGVGEEEGLVDVRSLHNLSALTHLSLSKCRTASAPDFIKLFLDSARMPALLTLELTKCRVITPEDMKRISAAANLRVLDMSESPVEPSGLHHMSGLTSLEVLRMDNCLMWGADCHGADLTAFLKSLKRLRELSCQARGGGEYEGNLGGPSVLLESILAHGSSLKNLQRLNLSRHIMPSKGNALQGLSALSSLTDLDLSASTVADDDLCQLSTLTQLQRLDLSSTAVTSEGLQQLCREDAPMELRSINVSSTNVDDRIGQQLARLPTLESVHLNDQPPLADISDSGLKEMTKLCALKTLQLRGNCAVTAAGLKCLSALPNLAQLDLRGCAHVLPSQALPNLQGASSLRCIRLGDHQGLSYTEPGREPDCVSTPVLADFKSRLPFLHTVEIPLYQVRNPGNHSAGWRPALLLLCFCPALWVLMLLFPGICLRQNLAAIGVGGALQLCGLLFLLSAALEGFYAGGKRRPVRAPYFRERCVQWAEDCLIWLLMMLPSVMDGFQAAASCAWEAVSAGARLSCKSILRQA